MDNQIVMIAPEVILADDNARFSLLDTRLDKLADDILRDGQVNDAIEVEPLAEPVDGCTYRVTVGHYRHAAGLKLNKEKSAGLLLPCKVVTRKDVQDRLIRQVSENNDRQNLTPMDSAVAIKAMLDAGIARLDVRKAFARPNVKGKIEPASNSFLNMMVSFLGLPKKAQNMLHAGLLPVRHAYELTKAPKDKQAEILDEAIKEREKEFGFEDKLEERYTAEAKKAEEQEAKRKEAEAVAKAAKEQADKVNEELKAKRQEAIEAYTKAKTEADAEAKKKAEDAHKMVELEAQRLEKAHVLAVKSVEKAESKLKTSADLAKEKKAKLEAARKKGAADKKAPSKPLDIQKAADKVAGKSGIATLKSHEIKEIVEQMALPNVDAPKLQAIGKALQATFYGSPDATQLWTPTKLMTELRAILGESKKTKATA